MSSGFKELEFKVHQFVDFIFVQPFIDFVNEVVNGFNEGLFSGVMKASQNFLFEIFPKPFDQVQVRRIWGQEYQVNPVFPGGLGHQFAPLIAGIVQNQVYAPARQFFAKEANELDNRCGFDIISCADAVQFMRGRVHSSQDVHSLAAA